jgi:hypothetical protein
VNRAVLITLSSLSPVRDRVVRLSEPPDFGDISPEEVQDGALEISEWDSPGQDCHLLEKASFIGQIILEAVDCGLC